MITRQPTVALTDAGLVICIPWNAVDITRPKSVSRRRRLTAQDVLELVEAGRLAHRLRKTRLLKSLKELTP